MWQFTHHTVGCSPLQAYDNPWTCKKRVLHLPGIELGTFSVRKGRLLLAHRMDCRQCQDTGLELCRQQGLARTYTSRCRRHVICVVSIMSRHVTKTCHLMLWNDVFWRNLQLISLVASAYVWMIWSSTCLIWSMAPSGAVLIVVLLTDLMVQFLLSIIYDRSSMAQYFRNLRGIMAIHDTFIFFGGAFLVSFHNTTHTWLF